MFGIGIKKEVAWAYGVGMFFLCISSVFLLVFSISLATKHYDASSLKKERDYQQELVYSISSTMSPQTISDIISDAVSYNEKIEKNRKDCDNKMWGFMYNKEVANIEPIEIPKYKFSVQVEE